MMKRLNFHEFEAEFKHLRPDNFSRDALIVLWDYFENLSDELGEEIELDVIAICCDFSELDPDDLAEYGGNADEIADKISGELSWAVALPSGRVLIQDF